MAYEKRDLIVMFLLFAWLVFSIWSFLYFKQECDFAQQKPLEYFTEEFKIKSCQCITENGNDLRFNKTTMWKITPLTEQNYSIVPDINLSHGAG